MSIDRISLVGVDERTDLQELKTLASQSIVKLEFGILYSETKKNNRYPSQRIIDAFASLYNGNLPYALSLHLCGTSVDKFLNKDPVFMQAMFNDNEFDAVQLNFSLKDQKDIPSIVEKALAAAWTSRTNEVIFQANKSKQKLVDYIESQNNNDDIKIRLLYDGSGGFGRTIEKIDKPFKGFYTGYAGGINPETIHKIAYDVELASGATPVYLDMESGVRENDWFSIEKCRKIIECVNNVKKQSIWSDVE
jgi:hypothetical protein